MAYISCRFLLLTVLFFTLAAARVEAKTSVESASPVNIISQEDIENSSAANVADVLKTLPGVPAATPTASDGQSISLRGLGYSNYTVLVDGRRVDPNNYAGVDLPSIPASQIDSIEILKDGASSVYGSDAISGVINFITAKDGDFSSGLSFADGFKPMDKEGNMTQIDPPAADQNVIGFDIFGKSKTGLEYGLRLDPVYIYDHGAASGSNPSASDILSNFRKRPRCTHMATPHYGQFLSSESFGQAAGISGPIITYGELNRKPTLGIYDASGAPVGFLNKDQIKIDPTLTGQMIQLAQDRSLVYQKDYLRDWSVGLTYNLSSDLKYKPTPWNDSLNDYGQYKPNSLVMPQLGMGPGDLSTLSGGLNHQLLNNGFSKLFSDDSGPQCGPVILNEDVFSRETLQKSNAPIEPNDPLYFNERHAKKAKSKKKRGGIILGSQMKMFGAVLGAGTTEDKSPSKPDIVDQWGLRDVGFLPKSDPDSAWNTIDGSQKNVLVAVIDSGLDLEHPDGPQYIWTNPKEIPDNGIDDDNNGYIDDMHGWNFQENNNDLRDVFGHGTNVAGIIAAKANNGIGIAGINPGAEIMVLKMVDPNGHVHSLDIYRAIHYAADQGAKIINISLGAKGVSKLEQLAINYAHGKGAFIVIAAGNKNEYIPGNGPASAKHVFTVGAQDYEGTRSTISSWGPNLALIAPAEEIYTLFSKDAKWSGPSGTRDRAYIRVSGTSFATPIVAATASLLLAKNPALTSAQLRDVLLQTASPIDEDGWNGMTGAGSLDATAALKAGAPSGLAVQITGLVPRKEKEKNAAMDIFGTVSGDVESFVVELGKGKHASKFKQVAGPYTQAADNNWLSRVDAKQLRGSDEWAVRITAKDKSGQTKIAQAFIELK